jgi:hypothetical protein
MSTFRSDLTRNETGRWFWVLITCLALLLAFVFVRTPSFYDKSSGVPQNEADGVPSSYDKYFRVPQNESNAVFSLHKLHVLENAYATAHPDIGYACQLMQLQPTEKESGPFVAYGISVELRSGEGSGYKFEIVGCTPEKNGVVAHYQVTAVPLKPRVNGVQAFCTDESGSVFYDLNGSSTECMADRRLLP